MIDLSTNYLGLELKTPLVPSASPLSEDIDNIKRMEDAGAAAVVFHSLFEEQIIIERHELHHHLTHGTESFAESLTFFPEPVDFHVGPEAYLEHIRQAKEAVDIPIIASLNGATVGGWVDFAEKIEQAGADAIELNVYFIPSNMNQSSQEIEDIYVGVLKAIKSKVKIPLAMKISPYFTNLSAMAQRLDQEGAKGLVLFNRLFQPEIDLEELRIVPKALISRSGSVALRLPLCWIGILYGRIQADLAATSGIHTSEQIIKLLMVGAKVTLLCSVLLQKGIGEIRNIEKSLYQWLEENEYQSVKQLQGSMSQIKCEDPSAFERAQYMRGLQSYKPMKMVL